MMLAYFFIALAVLGFLIAIPGAVLIARHRPELEAEVNVWTAGMVLMTIAAVGGWALAITGGGR